MTPETRTALDAALAPYAGRMSREDAIRGILESGPLKAICPHCGRQDCDSVCPWPIRAEQEECTRIYDDNGGHTRDRIDYLTDEALKVAASAAGWQDQWHQLYAAAVKDKALHEATVRERDEARAALDAMTTRARGMRGELIDAASMRRSTHGGFDRVADSYRHAAGEPIP